MSLGRRGKREKTARGIYEMGEKQITGGTFGEGASSLKSKWGSQKGPLKEGKKGEEEVRSMITSKKKEKSVRLSQAQPREKEKGKRFALLGEASEKGNKRIKGYLKGKKKRTLPFTSQTNGGGEFMSPSFTWVQGRGTVEGKKC